MNSSSAIKKILCVFCAAVMAFSVTACGNKKSKTDNGNLTSEGYELPFDYDNGEKVYMPVVDNSVYETVSTTTGGGKVVHLSTTKTEDEVRAFYAEYFKGKPEVRARLETDHSKGYYDADNQLVVFNLDVWTADGMTNYKMGNAKVTDIENDPIWRLKTPEDDEAEAATTVQPTTDAEATEG